MDFISYTDLPIAFFILVLAFLIANFLKREKIKRQPIYRYYQWSLAAHMFGCLGFCAIYLFYYGGGDTLAYHNSSGCLVNLFYQDFQGFIEVFFNENTPERYYYFTGETGYPGYWGDHTNSFQVVRFITLLELITFKSYIGSSLLMSILAFWSNWKLYQVFTALYPHLYKKLAWTVLFVPSVLFWGTGILKDTITLSACSWLIYCSYQIFYLRKKILLYLILLLISAVLIVSIKPYIFVALFPAVMYWMLGKNIQRIRNKLLRIVLFPVIITVGFGTGILIWTTFSGSFGVYGDLDSILNKAVVTQQDLKREAYQGNSFDIGDFEANIPGVLSKLPKATEAGLLRPYVWEAKNPVMLLSGLEHLIFLILLILILTVRFKRFLQRVIRDPFIAFCFLFSIIFAFSIGLTTSNFGALVRFKIPLNSLFLSACAVCIFYKVPLPKQKKETLDLS